MNRILLFMLFFLIGYGKGSAEELRVLAISQGTVKVGNRVLKPGEKFDSKEVIIWDSNYKQQIMKVVGMKNRRVYVVSSKSMNLSCKQTINQLVVSHKALATRGGTLLNVEEMRKYFTRRLAFLDRIEFETSFTLDDSHFFFLQYGKNGEVINKKLSIKGKKVIIDDNIFMIDNVMQKEVTRTYKMFYYDIANAKTVLITDNLTLSVEARQNCRDILSDVSMNSLSTTDKVTLIRDFCSMQYPADFIDNTDVFNFCLSSDF